MDYIVKEDPRFVRRSQFSIINTSDDDYSIAINRREKERELKELKEKVAKLESLISLLLQEKQ